MECVKTNPAKRPASLNEVARRLEIIRHAMRKQDGHSSSSVCVRAHRTSRSLRYPEESVSSGKKNPALRRTSEPA